MINGDMLRRVRKKKGWTQVRLEKESKVSRKLISKIERGVIDLKYRPTLEKIMLRKLAKALDVDVDYLMKGES